MTITVKHRQIGFLVDQKSGTACKDAEHEHERGKDRKCERYDDVNGKDAVYVFSFAREISSVKYLGTADEHDARSIKEMIERTIQTYGAHGSLTDGVTGIKTVNNAVDRIDHDQQYLVRKQFKEQSGKKLEFR